MDEIRGLSIDLLFASATNTRLCASANNRAAGQR